MLITISLVPCHALDKTKYKMTEMFLVHSLSFHNAKGNRHIQCTGVFHVLFPISSSLYYDPTSSDPKHPTAEAQKTYPVGLGVSRHGMAGKVLSTYLMWWPRLHSS